MAITQVLSKNFGKLLDDGFLYRSAVGALQYLLMTHPNISYVINKTCQYLFSPIEDHWKVVKPIMRYLYGTSDLCLEFSENSSNILKAYSDIDWVGCSDNRKNTGEYAICLGKHLISCCAHKQKTMAWSSTEAEYRVVANIATKLVWLQSIMKEIDMPYPGPSLL